MAIGNIAVGTKAIARVGRNAIEVEVIAHADDGAYRVRNKSEKEFTARRIEAMPEEKAKASREASIISASVASTKPLSLMNAAVEVLRRSEQPLNTREIVAQSVSLGLWTPTGARTPEQTLYGAIFREIATKENPRIVKAEQKGKFVLNRR